MDNKHLLLAEQYDRLGLFRVADSLDKYENINKNKSTKSPKNNESSSTLKKVVDPVLEAAESAFKPAQLIFLTTELKSLSKEATQLYLINLLENLANVKNLSAVDMQKLEKVLAQVKFGQNKIIDKEIIYLLENASNGVKPNLAAVQALKNKMPSFSAMKNLPSTATSWLEKMKILKAKNPAQAELAEKVSAEVAKKIPLWSQAARVLPVVFILLNALYILPQATNYFSSIANGGLDAILRDPEERAKFLVFLADTISSVTMFFPPAAPLTSALIAISVGYQGGMYAFDQYRELSGEKAKENLEKKFIDENNFAPIPNAELIKKYGDDFFINLKTLIFKFSNQLKTTDAKYGLRVFVYPEIRKMLIENALRKNKDFTISVSDIMNLPSLKTGETYSEDLDKNNNFVKVKKAPLDFISNPQDPNNRQSWFEFTNAIKEIVKWSNIAYKDLVNPRK